MRIEKVLFKQISVSYLKINCSEAFKELCFWFLPTEKLCGASLAKHLEVKTFFNEDRSLLRMYKLIAWCIHEIERRFHFTVKQIKTDDGSIFKGDSRRALQQQGISQFFVQPSVSGPFKTKLSVVERFNRTVKLYLDKLMGGQYKNSTISQRPAEVDDEEGKIATQKEQETWQTQEYYNNKYLNQEHPQAQFQERSKKGKKKSITMRSRKNARTDHVHISILPERRENLHFTWHTFKNSLQTNDSSFHTTSNRREK